MSDDGGNIIEFPSPTSHIAKLRNVEQCCEALDYAMKRPGHLPGMVAFYGPSGFGKSYGAAYAANHHNAFYVEAKSVWSRKALCQAILKEMGMQTLDTIYAMVEQISEQLVLSGRPLIIDEFDHLVRKGTVEIVRDLYESSQAAILIVGEELLPKKLQRWERFHNRILRWAPAQPATLADAEALARLCCRKVEVAEDLLKHILNVSNGVCRRIAVNLHMVQEEAVRAGYDVVDRKTWGHRALYTGEAPARRLS